MAYPASERLASEYSRGASPVLALPRSGTLPIPVRIDNPPLMIAERIGVRCASTL